MKEFTISMFASAKDLKKAKVEYAMRLIDAEEGDRVNAEDVVGRMISAGYAITETCDPVSSD